MLGGVFSYHVWVIVWQLQVFRTAQPREVHFRIHTTINKTQTRQTHENMSNRSIIGGSCRVNIAGVFDFLPQNFRRWGGDIRKVLCYSMNASWVVGTPRGDGDTQTLPAVNELIWTFFHSKVMRMLKQFLSPNRAPRATLWNIHNI